MTAWEKGEKPESEENGRGKGPEEWKIIRFNVRGFGKFLSGGAVGGRVEIRTQVSFPWKSDAQGLMAEIFDSGSRI